MKPFDLTPDTKVLIALTHTPLKPLDALSELIDNAIDSFTVAQNSGKPVDHPLVLISLPTGSELKNDEGIVRIRDNGLGMSADMAEMALRAGFTGNNPYDSLGLFGMGLNIACGKFARRTTLYTARTEDEKALKVVVDLLDIQERGSYEVVPEEVDKPEGFEHGTIIELTNWWPEGNPNYGFIRKLVSYGRPRIRKEIGRRYSSFLRDNSVRIMIDDEVCNSFEHCVWGPNRFVERRGHGKIPAIKHFTENVGSQTRCSACYALIPHGVTSCPVCGSAALRTISEQVKGWVGIQRYDDSTHFGIDLIRNGRVIRILEKAAFFEFTDEFGNVIKDYPADSPYGRIVGEIHLDHVPVDFLKQDFQRSSPEWQRALSFLRGDSSLQPNQPGAENNNSAVYMLYQGYRRVRRFGTHDMYMGYWDEQSKGPKRIDRKTEKEYLEKFNQKLPGYYDDSEWWKLVENADTPPIEELSECPECGAENLESAEVCQVCSHILIGKLCGECDQEIPLSAVACPHCGTSLVPEVEDPWQCLICGTTNIATAEKCISCDSVRGLPNPLSLEYLIENSDLDDALSIPGCSIRLADGSHSQAIDVETYVARKPIVAGVSGRRLPAFINKAECIQIFVDIKHPIFLAYGIRPEEIIASEVASYIHVANGRLSGSAHRASHTLSNIQWSILDKYWSDALSDNAERVREDVQAFFTETRQRIAIILADKAEDVFDEITEEDKKQLIENMIDNDEDISAMSEHKKSGRYLNFIGSSTVVNLFKKYTYDFFDGAVWSQHYSTIPDISEEVMESVREQTRRIYINCLEDCHAYLGMQKPDPVLVRRTRSSLQYLLRKFES